MTIVSIGSISDVSRAFPTEATGGVREGGALGSLGDLPGISNSSGVTAPGGPSEVSFGSVLNSMVDQANSTDRAASAKVEQLAAGANDDLHGTMIATKEADISMKLLGSVRSHLLDAFSQIWHTSV